MSKEYKKYLKKIKTKKICVFIAQIGILIAFIGLWELLAVTNQIDTFITSSPSRIIYTLVDLFKTGNLMTHIGVTLGEAIASFLIATGLGYLIAIILWWSDTLKKILDPYIVVLNSLPKIALGPIIIIWIGVGTSPIIFMAILIMIVISILNMLNAFLSVDENKILLLKSMGANKFQILLKLILPSSICDFMSLLKINVGLTWVGTIMGEYLVSRAGLGYLIIYGGQVFQPDLVMTSTVVLCVLASVMYLIVMLLENLVYKKRNR